MAGELIDTHCHLDFPEFDADRREVVGRALKQGVGYIVDVGTSLEGSERSLALAAEFDCIFSTIGIHPHEADSFDAASLSRLKELADRPKVLAVGEIGLDYFKNYSTRENQKRMFQALLSLAKERCLPVIIHSRDAETDTADILRDYLPLPAVVHCFSGSEAFLNQCLDWGFFVSFTANITYKGAQKLRDIVKGVPLERIFLETDAPFLAPEALRGRRNEPANIRFLAEEIARIKAVLPEEAAAATTASSKRFFNIR